MKQTQNQFFGKVGQMPNRLPSGSIYVCTDTDQTFAAGTDNIPVEISGIDDATKAELLEVLELSKQNAQGYYGLLSAVYFNGAATSIDITNEQVNIWQDVVMTIHPQGKSDERVTTMKEANAVGHTGTGAEGDPIVFLLEGLQESSSCNIRTSLSFVPDEDGGRLDSRIFLERHSSATPSEDFAINAAGLAMESGADEEYPHLVNVQFFIGDTINTNGPGDAGKIRFQVKSDVAGTILMNEMALFIQF
tara:strand:+ start:163 stop:906 length:744 start_codon:yes stop_codon:yes gene_type:complete